VLARLATLAVLLPALARATPLVAPHIGGPVFVGPTDAHVTALYWNPAAAGLLAGTHVFIGGTGRLMWSEADRDTIRTSDGEPDPGGDKSFAGQSLASFTAGNFAGFVTDFASNQLTFGVATYALYAEANAEAGQDFAYHASSGSIYGQALAIGLSYRLQRWVTFGFALDTLFTKVHLQFARDKVLDACAAPPCGVEDPSKASRFDITTGWDLPTKSIGAVYVNVGFLFHFGDWFIGTAFMTPPLPKPQKDADATVDGIAGYARVDFSLPAQIHVGIRRPLVGDLDLVVNSSYLWLSSQDRIDLRFVGRDLVNAGTPEWVVRYRGFENALALEAGVEEPPARTLRLGARARFQTSAVPEAAVAVGQIDAPRLDLGAGLEARVSTRVALVAGLNAGLYLPASGAGTAYTPSAQIACNASGFDLDTAACAASGSGRGIPTAAGSYRRIDTELTLGISYDVW
jgi:hypothetical protein